LGRNQQIKKHIVYSVLQPEGGGNTSCCRLVEEGLDECKYTIGIDQGYNIYEQVLDFVIYDNDDKF